jgi:hypothetical protein
LNRLLRNKGLRMREPAKWRLLVRNAARGVRDFADPVIVTLTFFGVRDADNHAKLVLDGLVHAHLLIDDRHPFVHELRLRARPLTERSPYTTVRIEPVTP